MAEAVKPEPKKRLRTIDTVLSTVKAHREKALAKRRKLDEEIKQYDDAILALDK